MTSPTDASNRTRARQPARRIPESRSASTPSARERVDLNPQSPWYAEHRSRYLFAARWAAGTTLDIAAGEAFGVDLLALSGNVVIGADVDVPVILVAKATAQSRELVAANGCRLPFRDGAFATVVSFETLEHIAEDREFLQEIQRVIRPGGRVLLSTPNALHTRPRDGRPTNPFHVREYAPSELDLLLRSYFSEVVLLGQRPRDEYGYSPYWQRASSRPQGMSARLWEAAWKLLARTPSRFRDRMWRLIRGRPFYPSESDFTFDATGLTTGHVLFAMCRR